jgi:eukaryotic-like serine/threonine-protein kinase
MIQTPLASIGEVALAPLPPRAASRAAALRRRVRQWELVELAARGSLALVYRARPADGAADRPAAYAVKMLRARWQNDPQAIGLLQREALVGQSVSHPHLAPVLSAAVLDAPRLLAMPWLSGASLEARLAAGRPYDVAKTIWIARQTAEALAALDAAGWTHGDVTPGNIHVSGAGHVTLVDLSFARRGDEIGSAAERPIMGTCNYLAPECLASALRTDIRSDIYGLGAVMFEMLSGRPPYAANDLAQLIACQRQSPPADLARLAPHAPRELIALVGRMMARDSLRRPQSPRELIDRLASLEVRAFSQLP